MKRELAEVLDAFSGVMQCDAAVWQLADGGALTLEAASGEAPVPPDAARLPHGSAPAVLRESDGRARLVAAVPGGARAWLVVGPGPADVLERHATYLLPVIGQYLQSALEVEHAARELAERYEEINLLYTTSEILGRTLTLEDAAAQILHEISETVGARRASILVHDRVTDTLVAAAAIGANAAEVPPIAIDDPASVSARVFRDRHPMIAEAGELESDAERLYRSGAMLSVPIMWTGPDGAQPLGVVNLSGRHRGQAFTAGDLKLVAAIATQIGTAIQNARLVRASLAQQRLLHEMQLAHDLQMKLLPSGAAVAPEALVAARVVPAESVGGDFYNLFRLGPSRTGIMIGDVSSHGYRAALIMALAMSAAAIHARDNDVPGVALGELLHSLRAELDTTEMFITTFYGVIDRAAGQLLYANAGHPHAFVVSPEGSAHRLPAIDPPLGMVDAPPHSGTHPWRTGRDMLLLFTDGISDARDRLGHRLGEDAVLDVVREHREEPPQAIIDRVFERLAQHMGERPPPDDLTMVVVRS